MTLRGSLEDARKAATHAAEQLAAMQRDNEILRAKIAKLEAKREVHWTWWLLICVVLAALYAGTVRP